MKKRKKKKKLVSYNLIRFSHLSDGWHYSVTPDYTKAPRGEKLESDTMLGNHFYRVGTSKKLALKTFKTAMAKAIRKEIAKLKRNIKQLSYAKEGEI